MTFHQGPRFALVAAVLACAAPAARADDVPTWPYLPPIEEGEPIVSSRLTPDRLDVEVIDLANNRTVIGPVQYLDLWDDLGRGTAVRPTVELREQPTGYDLVYTFVNNGPAPRPLGRICVGSILIGEQVTWQDFTWFGDDRPQTPANFNMITRNYPGFWYSPVAVFRSPEYAVGISFLYPMMEYKHDVRVCLVNNSDPNGGRGGWEAIFQLTNYGDEGAFDRCAYQRDLEPGETRTYVVAVRVSKNQSDWLRTLLPYREFFTKFYGGVRYARNTEPIYGLTTGISTYISDENPYGFGSWRPDLNGWDFFTRGLRTLPGWKNVMVWKPTGHYKNFRGGNMPFNFTTQWLADPELATALDPQVGFPTIPAAGKTLGFWWGHAASVFFGWDTNQAEALNPDNPEHVRRANAELDLAVQAGATMIGLDTFHPAFDAPWNLTRWVQMMKARYPQVQFVAEPISFDILHAYTPAFVTGFLSGGNPQNLEDLYPIKQPHMMANFLLPGNEIWASMMYNPHSWIGITPTAQMVNDDITRYARMGYRPIMFPPIDVTLENRPDQRTADVWNQVVPADLRASYKWNRNYANEAVVRRNDGSMSIIEASSPGEAPTPPPQSAAPPQALEGGGGMVLGSAPNASRHSAKRSKAGAMNMADATPDQITSTQRPDFAGGSGRIDTKVPGRTPKQTTKVDTSAPKERQGVQPSSPSGVGGGGLSHVPGRKRPVVVVPSSTPGMRPAGVAPPGAVAPPQVSAGVRIESGMSLSAVRQAILRAQRARPVAGARVVEVAR